MAREIISTGNELAAMAAIDAKCEFLVDILSPLHLKLCIH